MHMLAGNQAGGAIAKPIQSTEELMPRLTGGQAGEALA